LKLSLRFAAGGNDDLAHAAAVPGLVAQSRTRFSVAKRIRVDGLYRVGLLSTVCKK